MTTNNIAQNDHAQISTIFYTDPARHAKVETFQAKLKEAVDADIFTQAQADEALENFVNSEILASYEAHVAHASDAFSLRRDGFDKAAKGESYDDFYARSTARVQRETNAAILAQRARRNFLTPSQIIKEWKAILDESSKNISAPKHGAPQLHEPA